MLTNTVSTDELLRALKEAGLTVVSVEFKTQLEGGREIEYAWTIAVNLH